MFAELPLGTTLLPREKPVPKMKATTKWEKFAAEKGITKKKKTNLTYDANADEYRPTWGYGSKKNDPMQDWLVEFPSDGKGNSFF